MRTTRCRDCVKFCGMCQITLKVKIINKTAEDLRMLSHFNETVEAEYKKSKNPAKVIFETLLMGNVPNTGALLTRKEVKAIVNLPKYKKGTLYIVSESVKSALPNRIDLLCPGWIVKDKEGNILGCRSLNMFLPDTMQNFSKPNN